MQVTKVNKQAAALSKEAMLQTSCFLAEQLAPKHNGQKGEVVCKTKVHVFRDLPVYKWKVMAKAAAFLRAAVSLICLNGKRLSSYQQCLERRGVALL